MLLLLEAVSLSLLKRRLLSEYSTLFPTTACILAKCTPAHGTNGKQNSKILQSNYTSAFNFRCPINGLFIAFVGNNVHFAINWSDILSSSKITNATSSVTTTITRDSSDPTSITIATSGNTFIGVVVFK